MQLTISSLSEEEADGGTSPRRLRPLFCNEEKGLVNADI
jgi:hypothetical protein